MKHPLPLYWSSLQAQHRPASTMGIEGESAYPEVPERVTLVQEALVKAGVVSVEPEISIEAPLESILAVHDRGLVEFLRSASEARTLDGSFTFPSSFPSRVGMATMQKSTVGRHGYYSTDFETPINHLTWKVASLAAATALEGAKRIERGDTKGAYAQCRPPGHHAGPDFMGGFCYLNNAAIAAHYLTSRGRKVGLLDIDYHHGNGTQEIFWERGDLFFASLHGDPDFEYPYYSGYATEIGAGAGKGKNMNVPLAAGTEGDDYLAAMKPVMAAFGAFRPDFMVISAGFDAGRDDPICTFRLDNRHFFEIGKALSALNIPTLFVQEGGYNLEKIPGYATSLIDGFISS